MFASNTGSELKPAPHGFSALVSSHSKKSREDPAALAPLFGPPLESAFEEQKLEGEFGVTVGEFGATVDEFGVVVSLGP